MFFWCFFAFGVVNLCSLGVLFRFSRVSAKKNGFVFRSKPSKAGNSRSASETRRPKIGHYLCCVSCFSPWSSRMLLPERHFFWFHSTRGRMGIGCVLRWEHLISRVSAEILVWCFLRLFCLVFCVFGGVFLRCAGDSFFRALARVFFSMGE